MVSDLESGGVDPPASEVTLLLRRLSEHPAASEEDTGRLLELVNDELRHLASSLFVEERPNHTLQPTALVNEAWIRLAGQAQTEWQGKAHFFAIAAQAMRRFLVDHARARARDKRGGGWARVEFDPEAAGDTPIDRVLDVDEALEELAALSPDQAKLVELRFFTGLSMPDAAEALGLSLRTAEREWRFARAWLLRTLREDA